MIPKIILLNKGAKSEKGVYIGRGSPYGNPFPTKPSAYSDEIYKLEESLKLFKEKTIPTLNLEPLVKELKEKGEITLSCFCKNSQITSNNQSNNKTCHGEIIAEEVFNLLNRDKKLIIGITGHTNIEKANQNITEENKKTKHKSFSGEFAFLSNMFPCSVVLKKEQQKEFPNVIMNDIEFKSSEHAYQYFKSNDPLYKMEILNATTPEKAKRIGSIQNMLRNNFKIRDDWDTYKIDVMKCVVFLKFQQNEQLKNKLLNVEGNIVENNYWNDTFWGVCNGIGENNLGKILMETRSAFGNNKKYHNEYDFFVYKKVYKEISEMIQTVLEDKKINISDIGMVSGMARGVDEIFAIYAMKNNIPLILSIPNSIDWHQNRDKSRGIRAQAVMYEDILNYVKDRISNGCTISKINEIKKDYNGKEYKYANFARNTNIVDESDIILSYYKYESSGTKDAIFKAKSEKKYYGNVSDFSDLKPLIKTFKIKYDSDIFEDTKTHILIQGCNCFNTMGAGIANIIKNKFPAAYQADLETKKGDREKLGTYTFADVNPNNEKGKVKYIVNLYSQYTYWEQNDMFSIEAFEKGLNSILKDFISKRKGDSKINFSLPAIGLGLANGKAEEIYSVLKKIDEVFKDANISVQLVLHSKDTQLKETFLKLEANSSQFKNITKDLSNYEESMNF